MKITSRHDIEAPVDFVFAALTDFESWERVAMRRGADVTRTGKSEAVGPGMGWQIRFPMRGRERQIDVQLVTLDPEGQMAFLASGGTFEGEAKVDLLELGARRTRLTLVGEVRPLSFAARLMLQSLMLTRGRVQAKVNSRVAAVAIEIEERYRGKTRHMGR